jgi:hypothetical protein
MPSPPGRPFSAVDPNPQARSESGRVERQPSAGATRPTEPVARQAAGHSPTSLPPSQVSFVRTPDRVLRERRQRLAEASVDDAAAAAADLPSGRGPSPAADPRLPEVPADRVNAPPAGDPSTAWSLPTWLQPFAPSPDVRFTRTPETVLRRQALRHPRLRAASAWPAAAPPTGSETPIDAPVHAGPARPHADADAAPLPRAPADAASPALPPAQASQRLNGFVRWPGPPHPPEEQDSLPG